MMNREIMRVSCFKSLKTVDVHYLYFPDLYTEPESINRLELRERERNVIVSESDLLEPKMRHSLFFLYLINSTGVCVRVCLRAAYIIASLYNGGGCV